MATFSVSFDTGSVPLSRIQDAFALAYSYTGTAPDGAAETKAQFTRRKIREHIVQVVRQQEREAARRAAEGGVQEITLT